MRWLWTAMAWMVLAGGVAEAAELRLRNGARIPGDFKRIEGHKLVWAADLIGDIKVDTDAIEAIEGANAKDLRLGAHKRLKDCRISGDGATVSLNCPRDGTLAAAWQDLSSPESPNAGKITAALTRERGNNWSDEYDVDARATWQRGRRRHELDASVDYEKKRSGTSDDEAEVGYQLDFLRARGWYLYTKVDYVRDRFELLQESTGVGVGAGRALRLAEGLNLRLQAGPDIGYFDVQDFGRGNETGGNVQWRLDWKTDLWRLDLVLFHEAEYRWLLEDSDISHLETRSGVSIPLVEGLVAELRLDYDHYGTDIPGLSDDDEEWVFALGYRW